MFFIYSNGLNLSSDIVSTVKPIVSSWKKATANDPNLFSYSQKYQHDDGWGSFNYFISESDRKEHFTIQKSSSPSFNENHEISFNSTNISDFILLNHARKASAKMPITLNQNHPFVNETGTSILAHNGTLNKDILYKLLNEKEKPKSIENLSDTQILNLVLKQYFDSETNFDNRSLFKTWKDLISVIKNNHKNSNLKYSMNFFYLLKNTTTNQFYLFFSTAFSETTAKDYFKLYKGNYKNLILFSSSTIIDYLTKDFPDYSMNWNLQLLPNHTCGIINLQNSEKIEESF